MLAALATTRAIAAKAANFGPLCRLLKALFWSRGRVEGRLANLTPCLIGMEACNGARASSSCPIPNGMDAAGITEDAKANKAKAEADTKTARAKAATTAKNIWFKSTEATPDHPYLRAKGIQPHGARVDDQGRLVIRVERDGELVGLQFITPAGEGWKKEFLKGTPAAGSYYVIGELGDKVCIAEGFATAVSIHEATGDAVVVAFFADNLLAVAKHIECHPDFPGDVTIAPMTIGRRTAIRV